MMVQAPSDRGDTMDVHDMQGVNVIVEVHVGTMDFLESNDR